MACCVCVCASMKRAANVMAVQAHPHHREAHTHTLSQPTRTHLVHEGERVRLILQLAQGEHLDAVAGLLL